MKLRGLTASTFRIQILRGQADCPRNWRRAAPGLHYQMVESRVPPTLAELLTGAALAVAGVVVRNRFVGPDTAGTGESAAAMAGTALFLAPVRRLPVREVMLVP